MRQLSPGSPPSDDFDLAGSLSPEVKYVHVARLMLCLRTGRMLKNFYQ